MVDPTNILGKIGKHVGEKLRNLQDQINGLNPNQVQGDVVVSGDIDSINVSATGDLIVGGHLECDSLLVKGNTKVINTNTIELSDNILEINRKLDGSMMNNNSGIAVNRGTSISKTINDDISFILNDSTNILTDANIESETLGSFVGNGGEGIVTLGVKIYPEIHTGNTAFSPDPSFSHIVEDIYTGNRYSPFYEVLIGQDYYTLRPRFSLTTNGNLFGVNLDESTLYNSTLGYLREWNLRKATGDYEVAEAVIRTISYSTDVAEQPQILWKEDTEDWSIKLGNSYAELNGIFNAPNGGSLKINDTSIGNYQSFEDYLEDSI